MNLSLIVSSVFNCVNGSNCSDVRNDLCGKHIHYYQSMVVSAQEICDIISDLSQGKAPGKDKLTTEHLKLAGLNLSILLYLLCTYMLVHGYMPSALISIVFVPIIKDKNKHI